MAAATATTRRRAAAKPKATATATAKAPAKPKAAAKPRAAAKSKGAAKPTAAAPKTANITVEALLDMSQRELDALFQSSPEGKIPTGEGNGTVIIATGTPLTALLAPLLRLGWQGKVVDGTALTLKNKVLPFGFPLIGATIVKADDSRSDGKPTTVLDYSETALIPFRAIRDEVREVTPGLFLGVVYLYGVKTINFTLEF